MAKKSKSTIGVLRFSALGDVALCVPVLLALKRTYPETEVLFLTKPQFAPVVEKVPGVRTLELDPLGKHRGLPGLYRYSREIRRQAPAMLADLHQVLRSRLLGLFLKGSGIPICRMDKGRREKRALTRSSGKVWKPLKPTWQRYADVFGKLGMPVEVRPVDVLERETLPELFIPVLKPGIRIGIAPFAAHPGKCYPEGAMKKLIGMLGSHPQVQVLLFGGGEREKQRLDDWAASYGHCTSMAGRASLAEELSLISNLDLMISMDSGNGHLAAMYGVPVISIWGVTHPYCGFAPFGQPGSNAITADREAFPAIPTSVYGNKSPEGYDRATASIPPERIYKRILEVLGLAEGSQTSTTGERERK